MELSDFGVSRQADRLSNGVRLVVFERSGMPVSVSAAFKSGGRYDLPGKEGLAHFAEHMVVAGTERFPSKDKLAVYIEQYGGVLSASTGSELMKVNISIGDPTDFRKAVLILGEMLLKSRLDKKTFEMERGSVLRELSRKQSNPAAWVWEVWRNLFYQQTEVGRSVLGSKDTINALQLNDIKQYFKKWLTADRLTLIVSGGISLVEVKSQLEEGFSMSGLINNSTTKPLPIIRTENVRAQNYTINDQVDLVFGFRTCSIISDDNAALDIIAIILGGGRASTLSRILRYEMGLVYSVRSYNMEQSDHGSWVTCTQCAKNDLPLILKEIGRELKRVSGGGVLPVELEFAQSKIIKSKRMQMQTSESWVGRHTETEVYMPKRNWTVADYVREVSEVTLDDLQRVAKKYFKPDSWYLALCGDIEENEVVVDF